MKLISSRYLAELCMVADGCNSTLPSGMSLLAYLYKACMDASSDPDTFPVALSLLLRATQPYIDFLRKWAFEGNCKDDHSEFPIKVNWELVTTDSENVWNQGFILEDVDDPILGKLLMDVFICGKSLSLLKFCHPSVSFHLWTASLVSDYGNINFCCLSASTLQSKSRSSIIGPGV